MIYQALEYIVKRLNDYLTKQFDVIGDKAILGTIMDQQGQLPEENQDKIIFSLVNLENETNIPFNPIYQEIGDTVVRLDKPYNFNLDVLVTAQFNNYGESLKFLSESIFFFQSNNVFDHENSEELDPSVHQLALEIIKLSYHEAHSLWGAMGAKYMPSALFKIRMLSFQNLKGTTEPLIKKPESSVIPQF